MFECITRVPTPEEAAEKPNERSSQMASFGCVGVFFGVVPGFILWRLFHGIAVNQGYTGKLLPAAAAAAVALGLCAWTFRKLSAELSKSKARGTQAAADDSLIEEWRIEASRVVQLIPHGEDEPVLCFAVEANRVVMLKGQWLWDESVYGAPRIKDDPDENFINGLGRPYSFPSRKFTIIRWPKSGKVAGIKVSGDYLPPEQSKVEIKRDYYFRASEQFNGQLDDLQSALDLEAAKVSPRTR